MYTRIEKGEEYEIVEVVGKESYSRVTTDKEGILIESNKITLSNK